LNERRALLFSAVLAMMPVAASYAEDALKRELLLERVGLAPEALRLDGECMPFISDDGFDATAGYGARSMVLIDAAGGKQAGTSP
jgi:hypothetical protein